MCAQTLRCSLQHYQPTSETWHGLLGPAGLSTTAGWTFVQSSGLRRDSKPLLDLCCWDNLLIVPGIAHASNYPDESSLNCFVLTGATCGLLPLQWSHSIYQWTAVKTQRTTLLFLDGGVIETVEDFGDSQYFSLSPPPQLQGASTQITKFWQDGFVCGGDQGWDKCWSFRFFISEEALILHIIFKRRLTPRTEKFSL